MQLSTELDFIPKRPIFWRPNYLAQSTWLEHIPFSFWLVGTLQPRKIVELGTNNGSSYFSFCQAVAKLDLDAQCFAIDTWNGDEDVGIDGEDIYTQVAEYNQMNYFSFSTLIRSTFDQAIEHFEDGSIDLLHIDGMHTLDAVSHNFESWLPKLSPNAVVIMHDTNVRKRGFGVFQLFNELKQQYPHFEFSHGQGLGVIGVGSQQHAPMQALYALSSKPHALQQTKEIFSRLGKVCSDGQAKLELQQKMDRQTREYHDSRLYEQEQQALERGRIAAQLNSQHQELGALHAKLVQYQAREHEFEAQQSALKTLQADLATQAQQLTEAKAHHARLKQERDLAISAQSKLETNNTGLSQRLTQALEQSREAVRVQMRLQYERDSFATQCQQIERELISSRQTLRETAQIHQHDIEQLQQQMSVLAEHNGKQKASVTERFHELAAMTRHAEILTRELENKEQQLQQARERAQRLKETVSWKLTAPVRAIARTFKDKGDPSTGTMSAIERIANSGLFDELWYRAHYPEVANSSLSAIEHYLELGAEQGYNPSPAFDTRWYINTYPDVAQGAINPLVHYIMHGQAEQRHCLPTNREKHGNTTIK